MSETLSVRSFPRKTSIFKPLQDAEVTSQHRDRNFESAKLGIDNDAQNDIFVVV